MDVFIISVIGLEVKSGQLFGLDRSMNIYRSIDHGTSWRIISSEYFSSVQNHPSLLMSTGIPENLVSVSPESFWQRTTSHGIKWAGRYGKSKNKQTNKTRCKLGLSLPLILSVDCQNPKKQVAAIHSHQIYHSPQIILSSVSKYGCNLAYVIESATYGVVFTSCLSENPNLRGTSE